MQGYLSISDFAKLRNVHPKSLRYYERIGALIPAYTDPETGYMEFDIEKGRFSFRLTAPYSEERREAARQYARENSTTNLLK